MGCYSGPEIVNDGLVLHLDAANPRSYPGSGTVWYDLSGSGNNGTLTNGAIYGYDNNGIVIFDGVNDYVELGYKPELLTNSKTNEAWVYSTTLTSWHGIISNMSSWGTGFSLQIGTTQNISAMVQGIYLKTSWAPTINTWYHIVGTRNGDTNLNSLYVNGKLENSVTISVTYNPNAVTRIGCFYTSPSLHFVGKIPQVKIYNKCLTAQEIQQNFNATRSRYGI